MYEPTYVRLQYVLCTRPRKVCLLYKQNKLQRLPILKPKARLKMVEMHTYTRTVQSKLESY
jgi:hypothetical protein